MIGVYMVYPEECIDCELVQNNRCPFTWDEIPNRGKDDEYCRLRKMTVTEGHWIGSELGKCSVCGHDGCASDIWNKCKKTYCPNCGSLLKGVKNND